MHERDDEPAQLPSVQEQANPLSEITRHVLAGFKAAGGFDAAAEMTRLARGIREIIDEGERSMGEFEPFAATLGSWGWTIPMWGPIPLVRHLAIEGHPSTIDESFVNAYTRRRGQRFKQMARDLMERQSLSHWWPMLRQCLRAYRKEQYLLCGPALLTVLEGYLFFGAPLPGVSTKPTRLTASKRSAPAPGIARLGWVSLDAFVTTIWSGHAFDGSRPRVLNRHWVLHGRDIQAWGPADCLRLFQALDTLSVLVEPSPYA